MPEVANGTSTTPSTASFDNESSTHIDGSYINGTVAGDYQHHEQTQVNTPSEHYSVGSDTSASGQFTNFHNFDFQEHSSSYVEAHPATAPQHEQHHTYEQHHAPVHHEPTHNAVYDSPTHDGGGHSGNHSSAHHDSGHTDHGGGSHADGGAGH
jgi:hypothetical protein